MLLYSWQVLSLPRIECYPPRYFGDGPPFRHLGTSIRPDPLEDGRRLGDTVWGTNVDGRLLAAGWDWIEILPGVVCLVDPSTVLTNIRFVDALDCYEEPPQAVVKINQLIHRTPWQAIVCAALEEGVSASAASAIVGRQQLTSGTGLRRAA
jgi:hypothetical protein